MRKDRIIWIYPHLCLDGGGTRFLFEVSKRISLLYNIVIICNDGDKKIISKFRKNGIFVEKISFISANSNFYWFFLPVFFIFDFVKIYFFVQKKDIVFSTMFPSSFLAFLICKFKKNTFFHYCYEPFPYLHNQSFINMHSGIKKYFIKLFSYLYKYFDYIAVAKSSKIFTLNKITKKMINKIYGKESVVTLMGVDSNHFKKYSQNKVLSKYKNKEIIVHSTDYSLMKRTDLAIKIFNEVHRKRTNTLLIITSTQPNSPNKKTHKRLVVKYGLEEYVDFVDLVPYELLPHYYSGAICYLSTSYDRMLGTSSSNLPVKEALSCEAPVLRAGITDEDVKDSVSGFLIDPLNIKDSAKKIIYLIDNKKIAKKMGKEGRERIVSEYNWEKVASIILKNL